MVTRFICFSQSNGFNWNIQWEYCCGLRTTNRLFGVHHICSGSFQGGRSNKYQSTRFIGIVGCAAVDWKLMHNSVIRYFGASKIIDNLITWFSHWNIHICIVLLSQINRHWCIGIWMGSRCGLRFLFVLLLQNFEPFLSFSNNILGLVILSASAGVVPLMFINMVENIPSKVRSQINFIPNQSNDSNHRLQSMTNFCIADSNHWRDNM